MKLIRNFNSFISESNKEIIVPFGKLDLKLIIKSEVEKYGPNVDLNHIDVSNITDMSYMFLDSKFNGDISNWNTSNVTNMAFMFKKSEFNQDISNWNVSNVRDMSEMFYNSKFNGDISRWNVLNVTDMSYMFRKSKFNGDISNWDVSNVTDMSYMFRISKFNGDISNWDVSNVRNMSYMFENSLFNSDISRWRISKVKDMSNIFTNSKIEIKNMPSTFNGLLYKYISPNDYSQNNMILVHINDILSIKEVFSKYLLHHDGKYISLKKKNSILYLSKNNDDYYFIEYKKVYFKCDDIDGLREFAKKWKL